MNWPSAPGAKRRFALALDGVYARDMQAALRDISPVPIEIIDRGEVGTYPTWEALGWTLDQPNGDQGAPWSPFG